MKTNTIENTPAVKFTLRKKRDGAGDFVVRAFDANGARLPQADYYTSDWDDAVATKANMESRATTV